MTRLIRLNEDLSGRTIDVGALPDGHARQSYIGRCNLQGSTVIGDIRGSDLLDCDFSGADLSQAQVYGCVWRRSTFDTLTVFPDDFGPFHEEFVYELVRRILHQLPLAWRPVARDILRAHVEGRWGDFCALCMQVWQDRPDVARQVWEAMPPRVRASIRTVFQRLDCAAPTRTYTITWPNGVTVTIDRDDLPSLPRPDDRYALGRWVKAQAEAQNVETTWESDSYDVWVCRIRPTLVIFVLTYADEWFEVPRLEY